eukprot:485109_1
MSTYAQSTNYTFAFGNTQGDEMVLQQSPWRSQIWGTSPTAGVSVTVQLSLQSNQQLIEKVTVNADAKGVWKVYFNPIEASFNQYTITATSNGKTLTLKSILFGDVYICSGQSNMQFTVDQVFNSSQEIQAANNYPHIRIFTATPIGANTPQLELLRIEQKWSVASNTSISGGNFTYFSAMCWFFGKNMYNYLQYPIGLIATDYGGTPIRSWSSPQVLATCNVSNTHSHSSTNKGNDTYNAISGLWNAMIYPFLQTTIRAAIWYQGESDCDHNDMQHAVEYCCVFPTMIADWRLQWSLYSDTSPDFPFGFVQLSTWDDNNNERYDTNITNVTCGDNVMCTTAAIVRWGQTANYGYVPNEKMPNTFMATAIDLGDPTSPWTDIHPRYKQPVADRLTQAGKNIIYGESEMYMNGPIANKAMVSNGKIVVNFRNVGEKGLMIKNSNGFELYDGNKNTWINVTDTVINSGDYDIVLGIPSSVKDANDVAKVRYNWYTAPCFASKGPYLCAIYDGENQLPATPFIITNITSA